MIGAEDQNFCTHHGFDWSQHRQGDGRRMSAIPTSRLRGASTISQQTARTLFLVPMRSWIRKGLEAYLTVLIEALWPKKRILEAYLNLVDWGDGNFGAEAAASAYFGTDAGSLDGDPGGAAGRDPAQSRTNGRRPIPAAMSADRTGMLQGRSAMVTRDGLNFCVK